MTQDWNCTPCHRLKFEKCVAAFRQRVDHDPVRYLSAYYMKLQEQQSGSAHCHCRSLTVSRRRHFELGRCRSTDRSTDLAQEPQLSSHFPITLAPLAVLLCDEHR